MLFTSKAFPLRNFKNDIAKFGQIFIELHPFANILTEEEAQECEVILSSLDFEIIARDGNFQIWKKEISTNRPTGH